MNHTKIYSGPPLEQGDILALRGHPLVKMRIAPKRYAPCVPRPLTKRVSISSIVEEWVYASGPVNEREYYLFCDGRLIGWTGNRK